MDTGPKPPENWFAAMGRFLGGWPADYLVLDIETNDVDPRNGGTLPLQLGWCLVEGGEISHRGAIGVDWTRHRRMNVDWLAETIEQTRLRMEKRGRVYHCSIQGLQEHGVEPTEAVSEYRRLIEEAVAGGCRVVGHNFYAYDRVVLERSFAGFLRNPLKFDPAAIVDTGMVEKARMLKEFPPDPGSVELGAWYARIANAGRWTRWGLDRHCSEVYGLGADLAQAHDAAYDCYLNHLLLARMRALAEAEGWPTTSRAAG
jgi:DNA polymerase III epsilon subunit-like protein